MYSFYFSPLENDYIVTDAAADFECLEGFRFEPDIFYQRVGCVDGVWPTEDLACEGIPYIHSVSQTLRILIKLF